MMFYYLISLDVIGRILGKNDRLFCAKLVAFILLLASTCRAITLSTIIYFSLSSYFRNLKPKKRPNAFNHAILIICIFAFAFTMIYPSLVGTYMGDRLQGISRDYTGKNFFSGRQLLWGDIIHEISLNPLFGHGLAAVPKVFYESSLVIS